MIYLDILSNLIEAFLLFMLLRINVGYEKRYKLLAMFGWLLIAGFTTLENAKIVEMPLVVFYIISTSLEFCYAVFFFDHSKPIRFLYAFSLLVFSNVGNSVGVSVLSLFGRNGVSGSLSEGIFRVCGVSIYLLTIMLCFTAAILMKPKDVLLKKSSIAMLFVLLLTNTGIQVFLVSYLINNAQKIEYLFPFDAISIGLVFSTILTLTMFYKTAVSDKNSFDDQLELIRLRSEQKRFNQMLGTHEYLRKFKHDNAIHLKAIRGMAQETGSESCISEYIDNLLKSPAASEFGVYTGNAAVDATISETAFAASQNSMDFAAVCVCPESLPMPDFEFCALIGNMLDNAFEACMKVEKGRYIRLTIYMVEENLRITVKNSSNGQYKRKGNYFITDKSVPEYHGIGIKRIKETAEKYGGMCSFAAEKNCFEAICYLPIQGGNAK